MENLCEGAGLIGEYEAYLSELFIESNSTQFSGNSAITTHCRHVHVRADVIAVTEPYQLQTGTSNNRTTLNIRTVLRYAYNINGHFVNCC